MASPCSGQSGSNDVSKWFTRRNLSVLLLLLAVASAIYLALPKKEEPLSIKLLYCPDLLTGCGDEKLRVRFNQAPKVLQPFAVDLQLSEARAVHISFAMNGMEMGLNRYRLVKQPDGSWHGEVTLPVCVQGRSDWLALVEAEMPSGVERYQFSFTATR